ncbi:MAG: glycosyltransferase [Sandaracinaceae bacterium]|nr:glycosyltransferase [Sandaracinaceae bacterium]
MASPPVRVSVLMPVRDAGDTVVDALESVLATPHVPLEVVVVDDGSRDATRERVLGVASRDPRVRLLTGEGQGISAALNQGLRACEGEFIARMDADDLAHVERLGAQLDRFLQDPGERLGALGTRVAVFGATPTEGFQRFLSWQNSLLTPEEHARDLFIDAPLCHPSVMLRRSTLLALGGYRHGDFAEDYDLFVRLHRAGLWLEKLPGVLLQWRRHDRQTTFTDPRLSPERMRTLKAEHLAALLAKYHSHAPRRLVLWGAGRDGRRFARALTAEGQRAEAFVDVDPKKIGRTVQGAPVLPMEALRLGHDRVVAAVGSVGARGLIRAHLLSHGFVEGVDFFCVA